MKKLLLTAVIATGAAAGATCSLASDGGEFYKGKSVNVVIGYPVGGGYDLYARALARHIGAHIPGKPQVVVQNMPGAASLTATNYLFNVAPKDGTAFGAFDRYMALLALLGGNSNIRFKPEQFTWLGSLSQTKDDAFVLWARKSSKVQSVDDLRRKGGPELTIGTTAAGATDNDIGVLLRDALNLNIKVISGYPSTSAIALGVERGELDGQLIGFVSTRVVKPEWIKPDSDMRVLLQFARTSRLPELPDAPTVRELARNDKDRRLIEAAELPYQLARPFAAPPNLPAERAADLQQAFRLTTADRAFLADAEKMKLEISPVYADEALKLIRELAATPEDVLQQLRNLR
ncbi:MAG: Bug family tripartite tricarboxylate transporter substrate binding protein [Beijerinckiaceae bacterium]